MHILALDTSTSACSVAIWDGKTVCVARFAEMARGQSEHLIPMVHEVLHHSGAGVMDMDMIAVSTGPGAFTGVRIGLSAARGLALAGAKPLRGITTFDALAHGIGQADRRGRPVLALIDSKRGDVFSQCYDRHLQTTGDPVALAPEHVASHWALERHDQVVLCGDAAQQFRRTAPGSVGLNNILSESIHPAASTIARLAAARGLPGREEGLPSPLYLRSPDVKVRADGGRLRP